MRFINYLIITLLFSIIAGCNKVPNTYSESDNCIKLSTIRKKDSLNDTFFFTKMSTKDGRFWDKVYPKVKGIPDSLSGVKVYYKWLDNVQALYQAYKEGAVDKADYEYYIEAWGSDTAFCTSRYLKTFVVVATGNSASGQSYYMYDSNNDFDLSNEKLHAIKQNTMENQPHKVIFEKYIDTKIKKDSTWIAFYKRKGKMWLQFCEYAETSFMFDSTTYKIKVFPSKGVKNTYGAATFFEILNSSNSNLQVLTQHQYLKLADSFYRLNINKDGLKLELKKDNDVLKKGSDQVGMPPFSFQGVSLKGDSLSFPEDYKGKYVLLDFWSTGCSPCVKEIKEHYIEIYEKYGGENFEIIGVGNDTKKSLQKFNDKFNVKWTTIADGDTRSILRLFNVYQYPTLYLIDPNGVIISSGQDLRGGRFEQILQENIIYN